VVHSLPTEYNRNIFVSVMFLRTSPVSCESSPSTSSRVYILCGRSGQNKPVYTDNGFAGGEKDEGMSSGSGFVLSARLQAMSGVAQPSSQPWPS
jgi:hypothetical protein